MHPDRLKELFGSMGDEAQATNMVGVISKANQADIVAKSSMKVAMLIVWSNAIASVAARLSLLASVWAFAVGVSDWYVMLIFAALNVVFARIRPTELASAVAKQASKSKKENA